MISSQMQELLYNNAGVQSSVDSFILASTNYYFIYDLSLLPEFTYGDSGRVEIDVKKKTINHFGVTPQSGGLPYFDNIRQVSCRAYDQSDAEAIQDAAFTALNRESSSDGKSFFVVDKLPVIRPSNMADNYNAPLNVRVIFKNK